MGDLSIASKVEDKSTIVQNGELKRILYAFDFDHTIVNDNSDTIILKLLPKSLPDSVKSFYEAGNWTAFMDHVFRYMADEGITVDGLKECIREMPTAPGMDKLLKEICLGKSPHSKLLILSDSNDVFIPEYLIPLGITVDEVITNKATVTPEGRLSLEPYENQKTCPICPKNLCKGTALSKYICQQESTGSSFSQVLYFGDGRNDACPSMRLREDDVTFVRKGYSLEKILNSDTPQINGQDITIKARVVFWDHGDEIREQLFGNTSTNHCQPVLTVTD